LRPETIVALDRKETAENRTCQGTLLVTLLHDEPDERKTVLADCAGRLCRQAVPASSG
jgi:hypothetical protein